MTPTSLSKTASVENGPQTSAALPGFAQLAGAACSVGALPFAALLMVGSVWPAVSLALGVGLSLGVCGLLFLFIERVMPRMTGTGAPQGSQVQFLLLLAAKLALIALIGAAFLALPHVNFAAVLAGFVLGQSAIVVSALRFRRPASPG